MEIKVKDEIFTIINEEIDVFNYFVDVDDPKYLHYLIPDEDDYVGDYLHNDINVIVLNLSEYEWNRKMCNYKKIDL
jgi:hypothetical protein